MVRTVVDVLTVPDLDRLAGVHDLDVVAVFRDDHEVVRRGVRELLEQCEDIEVVGEAATAEEALARIPPTRPDVAVIDMRLPDGNGVEVCRDIRSTHPEIGCLMLTSFSDDEALFDSIMAGAAGYLLKQVRGVDLVDAVRKVSEGQSLIDPQVTARVLDRIRNQNSGDENTQRLTEQERKILEKDPFASFDGAGTGQLVDIAVKKGRATRTDLKLGICGEHGGDPASVAFCHEAKLDYVSCSPFRVPVARLEAGRASLSTTHLSDTR